MKNHTPKSRLVLIAEICGATVAVGLFCFQFFISKADTDHSPLLRGAQNDAHGPSVPYRDVRRAFQHAERKYIPGRVSTLYKKEKWQIRITTLP